MKAASRKLKQRTMGWILVGAAWTQSAAAAAPEQCGTAEILSGDVSTGDGFCPDLRVRVDLSGCPEASEPKKPVIKCENGKGTAEVETAGGLYRVPLLETWAGSWVISDDVTRVGTLKEAAAAPAPTTAPSSSGFLSMVSAKGSSRVRSETSDMTDAVSHRSFTHFRVRTEFTFAPDPAVTLFFQPQFTKIFGEPQYPGSSATANSFQETSGNGYDTAFNVHQAHMDVKLGGDALLLIGRQVLSYGNEMVIGAADWGIVGRSFDAARVRWKYDSGSTDLFASKIQDNNVTAVSAAGDKDFYGVYQTLNLGTWLKQVDLYGLLLKDATQKLAQFSTVNVTPTQLWTLGFRTQATNGIFDDRIELTKQWLTYPGLDAKGPTGFQGDVEVGVTAETKIRPRIAVEAFYASEDYNQLFTTPHKWLGYADVVGRRNLDGFSFHGSVQPSDKLKLTADYFQFMRVNTSLPAYKKSNTSAALGSAAASSSKDIGHEFDFVADFQSSKALSFYGGVGLFYTGDYLRTQMNRSLLDFYYAGMDLKF